jgi:hypothetical protein
MSKLVDTTAGLVKLFQKNIDKAFMSLDTSLNKTSHMVQRQSPVGFQQLTDRLNECCGHIMKGQTPPETGVKKVPLQEAFRKIIMNWVESTLSMALSTSMVLLLLQGIIAIVVRLPSSI